MELSTVTHEQIYERLCEVEKKVTEIDDNTKILVDIAKNLEGFINVCKFIGKLAKPILWLAGIVSAVVMMWQTFRGK